jgi:hypothetical protein
MTADAVGAGVLQRDYGDKITYGVLDPAAFAEDGGPSIRERIAKATNHKVLFRPADNKRVTARGAMGGWDQLRARLDGDEDGRPMLFFFDTCIHAIRTIPALQHDEDRMEDLDSDMEDHAADEVRYACMSRPYLREVRVKPKLHEIAFQADEKTGAIKSNLTFAELIKRQEKRRRA